MADFAALDETSMTENPFETSLPTVPPKLPPKKPKIAKKPSNLTATQVSQGMRHGGTAPTTKSPLQEIQLSSNKIDYAMYRARTEAMRKRREDVKQDMIRQNEENYQNKLNSQMKEMNRKDCERQANSQRSREARERNRNMLNARIESEIQKRRNAEERKNERLKLAQNMTKMKQRNSNNSVEGFHEVGYKSGDLYKGEWNSDGKRHGFGSLLFADGSRYCGRFEEGQASGIGSVVLADGSRYDGEWDRNHYHGFGVLTHKDGSRYEGQFEYNKPCGFGQFFFSDSTQGRPKLQGEWKDGACFQFCQVGKISSEAQLVAEQAREAASVATS